MKCNNILDDLILLSSGELERSKKIVIEAHIAECVECREEYSRLQALENCLLLSLDQPLECPDISSKVMAQIPAERYSYLRAPIWRYAFGSLAAAACIAFLIFGRGSKVEKVTPKKDVIAHVGVTPAPEDNTRIQNTPVQTPSVKDFVSQTRKPGVRKRHRSHIAVAPKPSIHKRPTEQPVDWGLQVVLTASSDTDSGSVNQIVVASSKGENIVMSEQTTRVLSVPPNPDASTTKRPPLQTIVKQNRSIIPSIEISSEES